MARFKWLNKLESWELDADNEAVSFKDAKGKEIDSVQIDELVRDWLSGVAPKKKLKELGL
jgi:hypothetical protein